MSEMGHQAASGGRPAADQSSNDDALNAVYTDDYLRIVGVDHWHPGYFAPDIAPDDLPKALDRYLEILVDPLGIKPGDKVLELGCNAGATTSWLVRRYGCTVFGIDVVPAMVKIAEQRVAREQIADRAVIACMDAQHLTFGDNEFDHVIGAEVLLHIPNKRQCIKEMARVLKPGGKVALVEYFFGAKASKLAGVFASKYLDSDHLETEEQYRAHLASAGFDPPAIEDHHEETIVATNRAFMSDRYRNKMRAVILVQWGLPLALAQSAIFWACDQMFQRGEIRHVFLHTAKPAT